MTTNRLQADVEESSTSNVVSSPYQKAEEVDYERSNLIAEEDSTSYNRKSNLFHRHFSFDALFGGLDHDEDEEDYHENSHKRQQLVKRKRKRAAMILAIFVIGAVLVNFAYVSIKSAAGSSIGDSEPEPSTCEKSSFAPDPIMALKGSSTVENVQNGAVAADTEICSDIGLEILQKHGGNAVDSAVAVALCLGVANPASSGIGGGAFIMIHADKTSHEEKVGHHSYETPRFNDERDHDKRDQTVSREGQKVTEVIDCREVAPGAATRDMFLTQSSEKGGLAVGVPGELRGLELAHSRHGKLPWRDVVEPAMKLARDGFKVAPYLAHEIQINRHGYEAYPRLQKLLTKNNDGKTLLKEGDVFKQPVMAKTLEAIMKNGANALYTGDRGEKLAKDIQDAGGIITAEDLADYRPTLRTPLVARNINGFTLVGVPPPSTGGASIVGAARFLSGYSNPFASYAETLSQHRFVEGSRHAFALRMSLSDPNYNSEVTAAAVNDMVWNNYMEEMRKATRDNSTLPLSQYGGKKWSQLSDDEGRGEAVDANEGDRRRRLEAGHGRRFGYLEDNGTTHLSVVDKDRNAVSITSSINTYFGSKVVSPSTGILLNSQMDDFATPGKPNHFGLHPSEANYIKPGKKPLSSMSPTLIFRSDDDDDSQDENASKMHSIDNLGKIVLVLGASGGPKIISAVLQVFINYCWRGFPLYESIVNPRLHDQLLYHGKVVTTWEKCPLLSGPTIEVQPSTIHALGGRHHGLLPVSYMGTVQAVSVDLETGALTGVSDIRKGGKSKGY